jgi:branched-chain amino acid aminotransferase
LLDGITRGVVIQLAGELHIGVDEGHFTVDQLYRADECFLTNTSMEIMPVSMVDTRRIPSGKPGSVTSKLQARFLEARERFLEPIGSS